jgi:hypothetical protein
MRAFPLMMTKGAKGTITYYEEAITFYSILIKCMQQIPHNIYS